MAVLGWAVTSVPEVRGLRQNWPAITVLGLVLLLPDLNRYFGLRSVFATYTPAILPTIGAIIALATVATVFLYAGRLARLWLAAGLIGIVVAFVVIKTPALSEGITSYLLASRGTEVQNPASVLSWLGFSYLSFRVMHTIRDRQMGRLPPLTLAEYVNYALFFPAFTAGPIDRVERFIKDYCAPVQLTNADWIEAGTRLFVGLFKKFVIADLLAVIAINDGLVRQVKSTPWMWVFLYAYAFRIFLDFSGYTDIAIGLGRFMGIRLPENFASPYLKPNLTEFWNSWHMTLTQWFRAYFFNPLTRALRSADHPVPVWSMILVAQLSTMFLIGLWHGVTPGFVVWGLWHGIGLFIHNRWSAFVRPRVPAWLQATPGKQISYALGVLLTFHYVAVGWLFFGLSSPALGWLAFLKLVRLS
jgi:D-alanyl-lipoteichoic acid acyltransferase DltB (MBOAT superfamily)